MRYLLSDYKNDYASYNLLKASLLQKLIRRGMIEEANYTAQLYLNENQSKGLRKRLKIIAAEDIGLGWPESSLFIENEPDLIKITSALCQAPKNREADRFLLAVANNFSFYKKNKSKSVREEVSGLNYLLNSTKLWYENKTKESFNNLILDLSKIETKEINKDIIIQLNKNYIELTKSKIHGARCQLSLAVLIFVRNLNKTNFNPNLSLINQTPYDEIFDFAIDMHTPIGKKLKRDFNHWINNCVKVVPEVIYPTLYDDFGNEKYPLNSDSNKFKN